jgi:uncharacterized protein YjlB
MLDDGVGRRRPANESIPFLNYHSTSHEVLGVHSGVATLRLGGEHGKNVEVVAGDVVIIPAGVAHQNLSSSDDFGVVGAYPGGHDWDLLRGIARRTTESRS